MWIKPAKRTSNITPVGLCSLLISHNRRDILIPVLFCLHRDCLYLSLSKFLFTHHHIPKKYHCPLAIQKSISGNLSKNNSVIPCLERKQFRAQSYTGPSVDVTLYAMSHATSYAMSYVVTNAGVEHQCESTKQQPCISAASLTPMLLAASPSQRLC